MQEEVENRTVNLAVSTTKLTIRNIAAAVRAYNRHRQHKTQEKGNAPPVGKMPVKKLIGRNEGVSTMDIAQTDLKGFEKSARKFGISYAIRRDESGEVPKYLVFFRAKDVDALTAAFRECTAKTRKKEERPSVLEKLEKFKAIVAAIPAKTISREKQREQSR